MDKPATASRPATSVVVMGVAGCGKSSLGQALAHSLGWVFVEGDALHSPASVAKMQAGQALTDEDRGPWLLALAQVLVEQPGPLLLSCSALRRRYRDGLRQAAPGLRFVYLALTPAQAEARVRARSGHFFSATLVASQFEALEPPVSEAGVLALDASQALATLHARALGWLRDPT